MTQAGDGVPRPDPEAGRPGAGASPTIAVVVPTYRRPEHLARCLAALQGQERPPDEVLVVVRPSDADSAAVVRRATGSPTVVPVHAPGLLAAMTAGAQASTSDIVAFTDDDAEPSPSWTAALVGAFADPSVGGVGGRDIVRGEEPDDRLTVGRVSRWGRLVGNHSRGAGAARPVDVLKGVNMAYRRNALALPTGYRGTGTQAHTEVAIGLWARAQGWKLLYDPAITVVHHEAPRSESDVRERWRAEVTGPIAHNLVAGMLASQPRLFWRRALYGLAVGDRGTPGVARALVSLAQRRPMEARAVVPSVRGQVAALRNARRGAGVVMQPLVASDAVCRHNGQPAR